MKILLAEQMRAADAYTIEHEPVASINLMERAARACAQRIGAVTPAGSTYVVFCSKGNNGGDGLAIARMLHEMKRKVQVIIVEHSPNASQDFSTNLDRLQKTGSLSILHISKAEESCFPVEKNVIFIDALLGTGLNKPVEGLLAEVIDKINASGLPVVAIDIPSGLFCDEKPAHKHIIRAQKTFTFQRPKLSFMFSDSAEFVGDLEVLDIGLNETFIESQDSKYHVTHIDDVRAMIVPRKQFSHKGLYGHALLLAGSKGKTGAAVLAAKACLRTGAGLLTAQLPSGSVQIMQTALPEAMVSVDRETDIITELPKNVPFDAIGMGPGIGTAKETAQALKVLIQNADAPLVLDADALNILSENKTWLAFLPAMTILTPHPKEFDRMCGAHSSDFDRLQTCRDFAHKHNLVVVLKSARTAVVWPDKKVFFNSSGNPALAKGGSGDVLTGIILGLLAQGYSPEKAALMAVFVHGHAADLFVKTRSEMTMLASDVIELLPQAFLL